jgi:hypothetical protein
MPYASPSTINWSTGMTGAFNYLNEVTYSWFSNLLLISVYIIFAMGFYFAKRDFFGAMAVAGFSTFVVALLLFVGGAISGITFSVVIGVAIIGFASLWIGQD